MLHLRADTGAVGQYDLLADDVAELARHVRADHRVVDIGDRATAGEAKRLVVAIAVMRIEVGCRPHHAKAAMRIAQ